MPGIAPHPPTRIVFRGLRLLRPLLLALLGMAVLAATAGADEGIAGGGSTPVVEPVVSPEETPTVTAPEVGTPEAPVIPAEQPPQPAPEPVAETPPAPPPPAAEVPPPAPEPTPPAPEAVVPEVPAPAPELPVPGPEAPAPEYGSPAPETVRTESAPEPTGETRSHTEGPLRSEGSGVAPLAHTGEVAAPVSQTAPPAEGAPPAPLFELAPVGPFGTLTGVAYGSTGDPAAIVIRPLAAATLGCEYEPAGCSSALPAIQRLLGEPAAGYAARGTVLVAGHDNAPAGNGRGNSPPAVPPLNPTPGPAPAGAAGGAGAGGSGGLAPTAFLTLAGLLLLAAPHARAPAPVGAAVAHGVLRTDS